MSNHKPSLYLGSTVALDGSGGPSQLLLPAHHLVTHGVVVGMTGSGKTGLLLVTAEEALRARVPVLMIDVKGDLPDLLLSFPSFAAAEFEPWIDAVTDPGDPRAPAEIARTLAEERRHGLESWGIHEPDLRAFHDSVSVRVITPGSTAGEPLHVLSSLERRSARWDTDPEAARAALAAAVSLVLRLVGRDSDPARSRDHVLLSVLAERRLVSGQNADLPSLLADLARPPIDRIGALKVDAFLSKKDRAALAAALNGLLASPSFEAWREGAPVDIGSWLSPATQADGSAHSTPAVIVSVAHLDDEERALVLGVIFEELLSWTRSLSGTQRLRALCIFDEVYGFIPPHPNNPPTKRPLVALMKQARAFGVGIVLATQNPMDLDYRTLGNAGVWLLGRLQTNADRARVIEGLATAGSGPDPRELDDIVQRLAPRWFAMRDVHAGEGVTLLQPRWALSWMRGPMTRGELRRAISCHPGRNSVLVGPMGSAEVPPQDPAGSLQQQAI